MEQVSPKLTAGAIYSRADLAELMGYQPKALETGIFTPRRYASVLLFITKHKTADRTQYVDELDGDDLYFDSQTKGRLDPKMIEHVDRGLEILVFYRETRKEYPRSGFRFEGVFDYVSHKPGPPNRFHIRKTAAYRGVVRSKSVPATRPKQAPAAPPRRAVKHYGLLANAATYDIQAAAAALTEGTWLMPRGNPEPGDTLLFWRTRGRDGNRGVVALGEVTHEPAVLDGGDSADAFWLVEAPLGPQRRVRFRFLDAPGLPLWLGGEASDVLSQLTVSRAQGNKLYKIDDALWTRLLGLATAAPVDASSATLPAWREGPATQIQDRGRLVDATFHVDSGPNGVQSVVLESRGGSGAQARNVEYNRGLSLLLTRLAAIDASVADAYVDSSRLTGRPLADRHLDLDLSYPIRLRAVADLESLRTALGAAMAAVGREPGARGGGNRNKRLRLVVTSALSSPALARKLAGLETPPPPTNPRPPKSPPPKRTSVEEAASRVLEHLREYGSLTEAEVTRIAGSPRAYRKLRRYVHGNGTPVLMEATPRGTLWRLRRERT